MNYEQVKTTKEEVRRVNKARQKELDEAVLLGKILNIISLM